MASWTERSPLAIRLTLTAAPCRARCSLIRTPVTSSFFRDDHQVDCLGAREERHGIGDGARGRASAVPTDEHALEREAALLDVRHDDDGTPGFEHRAFDDEFVGRSLLALRLTDNG